MDTDTPDTTRLTDEQVQESLSWLSRAQQAENHTVAVAIWANTYGHQLHAHIRTLTAEVRRLRAAQTTTLVACSRCGHGQRVRNMVALGDERLCVECAGVELGRLREALQDILDTSITNPRHDYGYMVWVNSHDQMVAIARAALNGDASATPPSSHCDTCGEEIATGAQWETFEPGDGSGVYVRCAACMPEEPADAE